MKARKTKERKLMYVYLHLSRLMENVVCENIEQIIISIIDG